MKIPIQVDFHQQVLKNWDDKYVFMYDWEHNFFWIIINQVFNKELTEALLNKFDTLDIEPYNHKGELNIKVTSFINNFNDLDHFRSENQLIKDEKRLKELKEINNLIKEIWEGLDKLKK